MNPQAVLFLADGFEEVEAVTVLDYVRRAGINLVTVGVGGMTPAGARGLRVQADISEETFEEEYEGNCDALILPGGMPGSENLARSRHVGRACREAMRMGVLVAAVCAAPAIALDGFGILEERQYTCYPGFENRVKTANANFVQARVCRDGNLITSRGPGTAAEFALAIVSCLVSPEEAQKVEDATLVLIPH